MDTATTEFKQLSTELKQQSHAYRRASVDAVTDLRKALKIQQTLLNDVYRLQSFQRRNRATITVVS